MEVHQPLTSTLPCSIASGRPSERAIGSDCSGECKMSKVVGEGSFQPCETNRPPKEKQMIYDPAALQKGTVFKVISAKGRGKKAKSSSDKIEKYLAATYLLINSVAKSKEEKNEAAKPEGPLRWLLGAVGWDNATPRVAPEQESRGREERCWCRGIPSEDAAAAFRLAGDVNFSDRKYDQALNAMNHELSVQRTALGPQHMEVGRTLNHMGVRMGQMGPPHEYMALTALEEALSNLQQSAGPGDEEAAITCHNLWVLLHNARVRQEALCSKEAAPMRKMDDARKILPSPKRKSVVAKSA